MSQMVVNQTDDAVGSVPDQSFFLSELLGIKVTLGGRKVGRLADVLIKENGALPVVTHLFVSLPFGASALIPWDRIGPISRKEIVLALDDLTPYQGESDDTAVLLKDHILDKKAIDLEGREMEVVFDIKLVLRNGKLYVTDVDLSRYGLLRRMGLTRLAHFIYNLAESIREQTISWRFIQPLPAELGRFTGDLRFKVLKEKLADMHPVDLADILSIVSASEADEILALLDPEDARKIQAIMDEQEANILNYATHEYLAFQPNCTAEQAQDAYRHTAKGKDVVMYLYIVDEDGRLLGVLDIKELLQAEDRAALRDVMVDNVIRLDPDSTLREAAELFARYDFRALPIVDQDGRILGVVMHCDVMGLKHRFVE